MFLKIGVLLISIHFSIEYDNLALKKNIYLKDPHQSGKYPKRLSVDGKTNQNSNYCALSDDFLSKAIWRVDLGNIHSIRTVQIYYRNPHPTDWDNLYRGRFAGFSLFISNTTSEKDGYRCFHEIQNGTNSPPPILNISCIIHGRYVIYYNERNASQTYPGYYSYYAFVELCEVLVYGCEKAGVYGENCDQSCPTNCQDQRCFIVNGTCLRCKDGYLGSTCNEPCHQSYYGPNCQKRCGNCFGITTCNHVNGSCPIGCAAGYKGTKCKEGCNDGKFGPDCKKNCSSYCKEPLRCNKETGSCKGNCLAGWKGEACDKICDEYFYGQDCNISCGNCRDNALCNHINGSCPNGCGPGYQGEKCTTGCIPTMYGEDCQYNCSSDCLNQKCNSQTGVCIQVMTGDQEESTNSLPGIAGALLTVIIVIIIITVVILLRRAKQNNTEKEKAIRFSPRTQEVQALNINREQNSSDMYASVVKHKEPSSENQQPKSASHATSGVPVEDLRNNYLNNAVYANTFMVQGLAIDELPNVIKNMQKDCNKKFKQEYETLPYGEKEQCSIGKMDINRVKNRFKTTFPYDHSRVVLQTDTEYTSDYINANYINGLDREKAYIAAQGPKNNTLTDFWRMIWQENVSQIVMLTNLQEGSKNKCTMYWPLCSGEMVSGPFKIRNNKEKEYANYVIREFAVVHTKNDQTRTITQYHYTAWPDHGTPESLSVVIFHSHVLRTTITHGSMTPLVVHCSAGIGRTGAYIALDALYKSGNKTGRVNISDYVRTMRKDRMNMVQTSDQYIAIYLALWEALRVKTRTFDSAQLIEHLQELSQDVPANKAEIRKEFKNLLLVRPVYGAEDFKLTRRACGSSERDKTLPLDRYCLHLTSTVPNRGMFINAIAIPSYRKQKQFIITPYPTVDNAVDLLRLLVDHDSRTVVSMENLQDIASTSMWLPDEGSSLQLYPFEVKFRTRDLVQSDITVTKIQLKNKESQDDDVDVTVVQPKVSTDRNDNKVLRSLVNFILNKKHSSPVTVVGKNGMERCGMLCAVHNALQQLDMDGVVDLFTIVRQIQIHRTELCSSLEEYQNCYRALS